MQLQKYVEDKLSTIGYRAANAQKVINFLYQHPLITAPVVASITDLSLTSSYKLINDFIKFELLREVASAFPYPLEEAGTEFAL